MAPHSYFREDKRDMWTPWGKSDYKEKVTRGINFYGTPSHGGYKVSPGMLKKMPSPYRLKTGWYDEDVDWSMVVLSFPEYFDTDMYNKAVDSAKNYHPHEYMAVTWESLTEEESYQLREEAAEEYGKDKWVAVSASMSSTPGIVNVTCAIGGVRQYTPGMYSSKEPYRVYQVPKDAYHNTYGGIRFILDDENQYPWTER